MGPGSRIPVSIRPARCSRWRERRLWRVRSMRKESSSTERGRRRPPKIIYVTPSHQFPLGATMSLKRRKALLEFAQTRGAYILEDDYNAEFRFSGPPLPCLQGLDRSG